MTLACTLHSLAKSYDNLLIREGGAIASDEERVIDPKTKVVINFYFICLYKYTKG